MKMMNGKSWFIAALVLLAGLSTPATADARAKYTIKAGDWLFTEADKARVDELARQAASRWNVIGNPQITAKFKDADRRYRAYTGGLEDRAGRLDIWKQGGLVSVKGYGGKQSFSFIVQTEFRFRDTALGRIYFSETRNLRCMQAASDGKCSALALEVWQVANLFSGALPPMWQLNVSQTCNLTGKGGGTSWKGHAAITCKAATERRPSVLLGSSDDKVSTEFPRLDVFSDTAISNGMVEVVEDGDQAAFYYGLENWRGARLEQEVILSSAGEETIRRAYAYLYARPGKNSGDAPVFISHENESTLNLDIPFGSFSALDYLCSDEWGTCVKEHIIGWEAEPDGRVRLDIDGCKNGICFKGHVYARHVLPTLTLATEAAP